MRGAVEVASEPRPSLFSAESTPISIMGALRVDREGLGSEATVEGLNVPSCEIQQVSVY